MQLCGGGQRWEWHPLLILPPGASSGPASARLCELHHPMLLPLPPPCRRIEHNDLSGSIPPEWAAFESLSRLVVHPGNPRLCGPPPADLPFNRELPWAVQAPPGASLQTPRRLSATSSAARPPIRAPAARLALTVCDDRDLTCMRVRPQLAPECGPILAPPPAPAAEAAAVLGAAPASSSGSDDGGGGANVGAIVGGAVGGAVAVAAALALLALAAGRRRSRRERARQEQLRQAALKPSARPFLTEVSRGLGACWQVLEGLQGACEITGSRETALPPPPTVLTTHPVPTRPTCPGGGGDGARAQRQRPAAVAVCGRRRAAKPQAGCRWAVVCSLLASWPRSSAQAHSLRSLPPHASPPPVPHPDPSRSNSHASLPIVAGGSSRTDMSEAGTERRPSRAPSRFSSRGTLSDAGSGRRPSRFSSLLLLGSSDGSGFLSRRAGSWRGS